mgnify:CR=1 FL=1
MTGFTFNTVGRIVSGPGAALELEALCGRLGIRRPLLVTDPGLTGIGLVQPLQRALEAAGAVSSCLTRSARIRRKR